MLCNKTLKICDPSTMYGIAIMSLYVTWWQSANMKIFKKLPLLHFCYLYQHTFNFLELCFCLNFIIMQYPSDMNHYVHRWYCSNKGSDLKVLSRLAILAHASLWLCNNPSRWLVTADLRCGVSYSSFKTLHWISLLSLQLPKFEQLCCLC